MQLVILGSYRDLYVVIATSAATLIGLLFVAMSVAHGRAQRHPPIIRQFRAAAALFAFTNAFCVSLFGLVPGNDVGYPAVIVAGLGLVFTAAGVRATLSLPTDQQRRRPQSFLVFGLLAVFGFQLFFGIQLIADPQRASTLGSLADVLIASLLVGISRSWELVGDWDSGLFSSLRILFGRGRVDERPGAERASGSAAV